MALFSEEMADAQNSSIGVFDSPVWLQCSGATYSNGAAQNFNDDAGSGSAEAAATRCSAIFGRTGYLDPHSATAVASR